MRKFVVAMMSGMIYIHSAYCMQDEFKEEDDEDGIVLVNFANAAPQREEPFQEDTKEAAPTIPALPYRPPSPVHVMPPVLAALQATPPQQLPFAAPPIPKPQGPPSSTPVAPINAVIHRQQQYASFQSPHATSATQIQHAPIGPVSSCCWPLMIWCCPSVRPEARARDR